MRILVFESITGGGLFSEPGPPLLQSPFLNEGRAMVQAITADLLALPEVEVLTTRDARLGPIHPPGCQVTLVGSALDERDTMTTLAGHADWVLLIAPESDGALLRRTQLVEAAGRRLLLPGSAVVELAADKQATAELLQSQNVPAPTGWIVKAGETPLIDFVPAVVKPIDGCGSHEVRLYQSRRELQAAIAELHRPMRLERFVPGLAASVAVLCGPAGHVALPACQQRLSDDGRFTYLGGRTPLPQDLDRRARNLALAAIATLPNPIGYIGVDLVLGDAPDGSGDCVIEINPRLTTSYVGLRAACRDNLAAAMIATASGQPATLSFRSEPVEFDADGTIRPLPLRGAFS